MFSIFRVNINKVLTSNKHKDVVDKENYVKSVLEKMRSLIIENEKTEENVFDELDESYEKIKAEDKKEKDRLSKISTRINNFVKKSSNESSRSGELYEHGSAYERNFLHTPEKEKPNESGFDLNEALHPKEDLEEIMKAFDFANSKNNKND